MKGLHPLSDPLSGHSSSGSFVSASPVASDASSGRIRPILNEAPRNPDPRLHAKKLAEARAILHEGIKVGKYDPKMQIYVYYTLKLDHTNTNIIFDQIFETSLQSVRPIQSLRIVDDIKDVLVDGLSNIGAQRYLHIASFEIVTRTVSQNTYRLTVDTPEERLAIMSLKWLVDDVQRNGNVVDTNQNLDDCTESASGVTRTVPATTTTRMDPATLASKLDSARSVVRKGLLATWWDDKKSSNVRIIIKLDPTDSMLLFEFAEKSFFSFSSIATAPLKLIDVEEVILGRDNRFQYERSDFEIMSNSNPHRRILLHCSTELRMTFVIKLQFLVDHAKGMFVDSSLSELDSMSTTETVIPTDKQSDQDNIDIELDAISGSSESLLNSVAEERLRQLLGNNAVTDSICDTCSDSNALVEATESVTDGESITAVPCNDDSSMVAHALNTWLSHAAELDSVLANKSQLPSLSSISPQTLQYLKSIGDAGVVAEMQIHYITQRPELREYYTAVIKYISGTLLASLSISSGMVANSSQSFAEQVASALDSVVGAVGGGFGVSLATGLLNFLVKTKNDIDRTNYVRRITTSFPSVDSQKFVEILSRELCLLQEDSIVEVHFAAMATKSTLWDKISTAVEWLSTYDNASSVQQLAYCHSGMLIDRLMRCEPPAVVQSLNDVNQLIKWALNSDTINDKSIDELLQDLRSSKTSTTRSSNCGSSGSDGIAESKLTTASPVSSNFSMTNADDLDSVKSELASLKAEQAKNAELAAQLAAMQAEQAKKDAQMALLMKQMEAMQKSIGTFNSVFGGSESQLQAMNTESIYQKIDQYMIQAASDRSAIQELTCEVRCLREDVDSGKK